MTLAVVPGPRTFTLHGFSTVHDPMGRRGAEMLALLDRVWAEVRSRQLQTTGINHAVYDVGDTIFAGLELRGSGQETGSLERRDVILHAHVHWRHVGPWGALGETYKQLEAAVQALGRRATQPQLEVYGHATDDVHKQVADLFVSVE